MATIRSQAADTIVPEGRRTEAFGMLYPLGGLGFALGSIVLAALPLSTAMLLGGAGAALTILLAPFLLRSVKQRTTN